MVAMSDDKPFGFGGSQSTGTAKTATPSPLARLRSPDVSWIKLERWNALFLDERQRFPPICPDFVIELRSETDNLKKLQAKMQEYLGSGIRLGWLIDPKTKKVEIYRPSQEVEVLHPTTLSGEDVLPGFGLDLKPIWGE